MTFKEFMATMRHVDDLREIHDDYFDDPTPGCLFDDAFWVADPTPDSHGDYWTVIERDDVSGTLDHVARHVYMFAAFDLGWTDLDFVRVVTVRMKWSDSDKAEQEVVGFIEVAPKDGGDVVVRHSDTLPDWIADQYLKNYERLPEGFERFGYVFGEWHFMVGGAA